MQDTDWNDLKLVLAIFRGGTFAGAARLLKVNQSTITRRLTACETRLSAQLFERGPVRLMPTAAGEKLIAQAERIEQEVQQAFGEVAEADLQAAGTVRVTAVPILINHLFIPALPTLWRGHPELRVELIAEPRDLSLRKREADIAVRLARPIREAGMTASKIGELAYGAYGASSAARDLPWIGYEDSMSDLPNSRWIAKQTAEYSRLAVNDATGLLAALSAGLGKSVLPKCIADARQDLRRIPSEEAPPDREIWMLVHPDLRSLARVAAVSAWIRATVKRTSRLPTD